jgi:hypothetical protein
MKVISLIFAAAATGIGVVCASSLALKASQDYCTVTTPPDPFITQSVQAAVNHRNFCKITDTLSHYNPLYSYKLQETHARPTFPNVSKSPYTLDPYLGNSDS